MKRKIIILTIAFLSSVLMCANVFAAASGRCGDSITWTLDDSGNLTLSGSGEMWNYGIVTSPFKDYGIKTVTIGDGITSIGDYAFYSCRGLTELTLPNSVTSIGNPNSVTSIGNSAFGGCSGLEKITVDGGNKRYDSRDNCNSIIETGTNTLIVGCKNSVIPNSVTSIGDGAFRGCSGLTELILPNSVTSIGEYAFYYCSELTELTLPNSVTSIGWYAFQGCTGLTELILPNSVRSIGDFAFSYCSGLEKITVESGNSRYDSRDNCNSIIDTEFNTLIVGCKNSIIPNSVTSIGDGAFWGCTGLTELTLPNSVTSIVDYAFYGCSGLSKITSLAEIPPVCGREVFDRVNKTNCELIVLEGSVAAYTQAKGWKEFSNIRGFSGVEVTVAEGNTIRAIGNQIEISGDFTSVEVYGVNGVLIYKGKDNVVTVPSAGIYLVHVAGKTRKIVVE